jgi:hypothetical protein
MTADRVHVINGKYKGAVKRDELCGTGAGSAMRCVCMYRNNIGGSGNFLGLCKGTELDKMFLKCSTYFSWIYRHFMYSLHSDGYSPFSTNLGVCT